MQSDFFIYATREILDKINELGAQQIVQVTSVALKTQKANTNQHIFVQLTKNTVSSQKFMVDNSKRLIEGLSNFNKIITKSQLLQQLTASSFVRQAPYVQCNKKILDGPRVRLCLPSTISEKEDIQMQLLGFVLNPNGIFSSVKRQMFDLQSLDALLEALRVANKQVCGYFSEKDWKNASRILPELTYELQLQVKITNIRNSGFSVEEIDSRANSLRTKGTSLRTTIADFTSQKFKKQLIQNAKNLISNYRQQKQQQNLISRPPRKIYNPHIFLKKASKQKYLEYYCKGVYEYYHYLDQSFGDQGWGCAYRALQTVLSWMLLQGYTSQPVPTLPQIQELIDRINLTSKTKLKGTQQWIGATQVSWVITKLTGLNCRILHVSDGQQILQNCEVLREHFEKVGCPVMYGGGQYAYSVVGMHYSWKLGQCQFLILDPHYTGQDSIDQVLSKKGGLTWRKPEEMFKKGVFYNFCLPILS